MKKSPKKLALSRETLTTLGAVQGGDLPALQTIDLLPRSLVCQSRFCDTTVIQTVVCTVLTSDCPITTF